MLLFLCILVPGSHSLFFGLGGEAGGCSCPSSCGSPPPANFGCRLMCQHVPAPCQSYSNQNYYQQTSYGQQNYDQTNSYQQSQSYYGNNQNIQPSYQGYRSAENNYAGPHYPQQQVVSYVPQAPTRYVDNYAQAVARIADNFERHPPPPAAPPTYTHAEHEPSNNYIHTFATAAPEAPAATYATATDSVHRQQISLLPPAGEEPLPSEQETETDHHSGTYYSASTEIPLQREESVSSTASSQPLAPKSLGKSATSTSWGGATSPDDIVKSIEDSYDEKSDELTEQKEVQASNEEHPKVEIATNQVTILPAVTYGGPIEETSEPIVEVKPVPPTAEPRIPKVVEYALGSSKTSAASDREVISAVSTTTSAAIVFKTLTRSEGYTSENISSSGYAYKSTTPDSTEYDEITQTSVDTEIESNSVNAENNYERAQETANSSYEKKIAAKRSQDPSEFKCNSAKLREIMDEKMSTSAPVSKQLIYAAATAAFPGLSLDVICSRYSFSYIVVTSPIYCEHRKAALTCFAFFQP